MKSALSPGRAVPGVGSWSEHPLDINDDGGSGKIDRLNTMPRRRKIWESTEYPRLARRIIIDGIKVEGDEASRITNDVLRDVDETGTPRRLVPLGMLVGTAVFAGVASGVTGWVLVRIVGLRGAWFLVICVAVALAVTFAWRHVHLRLQRRLL